MDDTTAYRLDVMNDTATLTINRLLAQTDLSALLGRCRELAAHVVMLKIDLRPRGVMSAGDNRIVRSVLDAWRRTRGGSFQLTTSHLVASCRQVTAAPRPAWSSSSRSPGTRTARLTARPIERSV